eukprot:Platyproteum_vivax@DN7933_c0_g1_i1.p1
MLLERGPQEDSRNDELNLSNSTTYDIANSKWQYACKNCRSVVCFDTLVIPHDPHSPNNDVNDCTSLFVEPMRWMGPMISEKGRLQCYKCQGKLGAYCWHGLTCSCGVWATPAFQIHKSKVDKLCVKTLAIRGETLETYFQKPDSDTPTFPP